MIKFRRSRIWLKQNGFVWTALRMLSEIVPGFSTWVDRNLNSRERRLNLPGSNSIEQNYVKWRNYNWGRGGDEWTPSEKWKHYLVEEVLRRYMNTGLTILEIGPGSGRWTEYLQPLAKNLVLVDLAESCIEICKQKFRGCTNLEYHVNKGNNLSFLSEESIDRIWSFDVFVHIDPRDTEKYLIELGRILSFGGLGAIHHHKEGGARDGFRSRMTDLLFREYTERAGLRIVKQISSWGPNNSFSVNHHSDIISVFEKPLRSLGHTNS